MLGGFWVGFIIYAIFLRIILAFFRKYVKIEYAKNLASLYVGADSELQVAELSVENKNYKIGIKSTKGGVQTFAPIPILETSSDTEIATVSNVRNLKTDLQANHIN